MHTVPDDVERALVELGRQQPGLRKAVVKLNESFSGEGNAIFRFPEHVTLDSVRQAMGGLELAVSSESHDHYFRKFARMGGVVEAFIDAPHKLSPSAQLRTTPRGETSTTSTSSATGRPPWSSPTASAATRTCGG